MIFFFFFCFSFYQGCVEQFNSMTVAPILHAKRLAVQVNPTNVIQLVLAIDQLPDGLIAQLVEQ